MPTMATTEPKRCLTCGYILDHLTEPRCPECGLEFDPNDPSTHADPAPSGPRVWPWAVVSFACVVAPILTSELLDNESAGTWRDPTFWTLLFSQLVNGVVFVRSILGVVSRGATQRWRWIGVFLMSLFVLVGCGGVSVVLGPLRGRDLPP